MNSEQPLENFAFPGIDRWQGCITRLANGLPIEVDPRDLVGSHILAYGAWEKETVAFVCNWLRPGMTVIDVGAHIGQYTMIASVCVEAIGRVHAFEPHPGLFGILQRNILRAHCKNVVSSPLALGRSSTQRRLYTYGIDNLGAASLMPIYPTLDASVPVNVVRLDDYVAANAVGRVDFVKIDAEGAELEILEGAAQTLDTNAEIVLLVEFYAPNAIRFGYSLGDLEAKLRGMGFHLFALTAQGIAPYRYLPDICQNVVAARQLPHLLRGLAEGDAARLLLRLGQASAL